VKFGPWLRRWRPVESGLALEVVVVGADKDDPLIGKSSCRWALEGVGGVWGKMGLVVEAWQALQGVVAGADEVP